MYERILVAVDASETADTALDEALRLAGIHGSTVRVVHVVDLYALYGDEGPPAEVAAHERAECAPGGEIIARALAKAAQAGIPAEGRALRLDHRTQRIAEVIVEDAQRWGAALVMIGSHSHPRLHGRFLGSVAEGVVHQSPIPVLLITGTEVAA
jgi:nucleotide-binding universal stress UspA family protein